MTDSDYEDLKEQIFAETDMEALKEAAYAGRDEKSKFAFCRLTGFRYRAPERNYSDDRADFCAPVSDTGSHRSYWCNILPAMRFEPAETFCREMIEKEGPFAEEAELCLQRHMMYLTYNEDLANKLVVIRLTDNMAFQHDADVCEVMNQIQKKIGESGRFMTRLSGILPEVKVFVEAEAEELCESSIADFLAILKEKGHLAE